MGSNIQYSWTDCKFFKPYSIYSAINSQCSKIPHSTFIDLSFCKPYSAFKYSMTDCIFFNLYWPKIPHSANIQFNDLKFHIMFMGWSYILQYIFNMHGLIVHSVIKHSFMDWLYILEGIFNFQCSWTNVILQSTVADPKFHIQHSSDILQTTFNINICGLRYFANSYVYICLFCQHDPRMMQHHFYWSTYQNKQVAVNITPK